MDISNVIIGAVAMALCALPFIMMSRSKNKREKYFLESLSKAADKCGCKIEQYEVFSNFAIGIDTAKKVVFYCRKAKDSTKVKTIKCAEIKSCKINKISKDYDGRNIIDKLELNLTPIHNNHQAIILVFYKSKVNAQLYGELQAIEKWSQLINNQLT